MLFDALIMILRNMALACVLAVATGVTVGVIYPETSEGFVPSTNNSISIKEVYDHPLAPMAREEILARIHTAATKNQVDPKLMENIIRCESNYNPLAVGDHGASLGLVQIHLPAHRDISIEQAQDPAFSIEFLAHQIKIGNASLWSCFNLMKNPNFDFAYNK